MGFLIGIAGGSGSGKTTFAKKILSYLLGPNQSQVALIHQDSYYLAEPAEQLKIQGAPNFDHPGAFDWLLLKQHLLILKEGGTVQTPVYDFRKNRRTSQTLQVGPCSTILMEGIYALWDYEIRKLSDLNIFLHVEADIRFIRRLHRDAHERGRNLDNIIRQYYDTVRPMHHEFLEPTRQFADFIVGEETDVAANVVAARINEMIANVGPTQLFPGKQDEF